MQIFISADKEEEKATVLQQLQSRLEGWFPGQKMPRQSRARKLVSRAVNLPLICPIVGEN